MPAEPLIPDGWKFNPNRSATLTIDGHRYELRAPRIGELEKLADAYDAHIDETRDNLAEVDRRNEELLEEVKSGSLSETEANKQVRALRRDLDRFVRDGWWSLLRSVFDMLGSAPLPADDELPGWLASSAGQQLGDWFGHVRSAPPPRGSSEKQD